MIRQDAPHWLIQEPFESYEAYLRRKGKSAVDEARGRAPEEIVAEIERAGLRGRGGAGFPTGAKWRTTMRHEATTRYAVCNAAEGEPGNYGALEMQVGMDFYVGMDQDVTLAAEIIREACLTSPYVFFPQPIPVLAKQIILQDYVAFHLKARPYVFDCKYEKPFETDVHFRVLEAFREHGINPPALLHRSLPVSRVGVDGGSHDDHGGSHV